MASQGTGLGSSDAPRRKRLRFASSRLPLSLVTGMACLQGACTLISPSDQTYLSGNGSAGRSGFSGSAGSQISKGGEAGEASGGTSGSGPGTAGAAGAAATYIAFDVKASGALPENYQVKYVFDSTPYIQAGTLDSACANIIVRANAAKGCDQVRPSWVSPESCGTQQTELWVQIPSSGFGTAMRFVVQLGQKPEQAYGPTDVFDFFDGFEGTTLSSDWQALPVGGKALSVKGGELTGIGVAAIQSKTAWLKPGQTVYGVRVQAQTSGASPELAGGAVTSAILASGKRAWNGLGILSGADGFPQGTLPALIAACWGDSNDVLKSPPSNWAYSSGVNAKYQLAEFGYDQGGGTSTGTLSTSRGYSATWTVGQGCATPTSLPILIVLDEATAAGNETDPTQRIDYVYVRKSTKAPPTVIAKGNSSGQDCGFVAP